MTPKQAKRLGAFIATQREARGLSQRKLAEAIGVQNTTIMRLEAGRYSAPSPDNLARIAEVLGVGLADIYAMADYVVPDSLPTLAPYLRAKYRDLPDEAAAQIEAYARKLAKRHGVDLSCRAPSEDEEPAAATITSARTKSAASRTATRPKKKVGAK